MAQSRTRALGYFEVSGPEGRTEIPTFTCCHCNTPVEAYAKDAIERGFCRHCMADECLPCARKLNGRCVPFERQLEKMEAVGRQRARLLQEAGIGG